MARKKYKYNDIFCCQKCGNECTIEEVDPGRWECYCDICENCAEGFDVTEYEADQYSQMVDETYERIRADKLEFNS